MSADLIKWPDLSRYGFGVVLVTEGDQRSVAVHGSRDLVRGQTDVLRSLGFSEGRPGLYGLSSPVVWTRRGPTFQFSELQKIFQGLNSSDVKMLPRASTRRVVALPQPLAAPARSPQPSPRPSVFSSSEPSTKPVLPPPITTPSISRSPVSPSSGPPVQGARPVVPPRPSVLPRAPVTPSTTDVVPPRQAPPSVSVRPAPPRPPVPPVGVQDRPKTSTSGGSSLSSLVLPEEEVLRFEEVNRYQVRYRSGSKATPSVAMIPKNLAEGTFKALQRIEREHGDIDAWVARRLQWTPDEMGQYLACEQVDAVALALYARDKGRQVIVADQTGLGKGRILAALARAAVLEGIPFVFVTEKENLFSDFWRDVRDIGSDRLLGVPFMLNDGAKIVDMSTAEVRTVFSAPRTAEIKKAVKAGRMPSGHKVLMLTYSQLNRKGPKIDFVKNTAQGAFIALDEAHNAVGDSNTSASIREVTSEAAGAVHSSATFARNAKNLSAYRKVFPHQLQGVDLESVLGLGGPALLEALSQTLAEDGSLIRREHDLSNIQMRLVEDHDHMDRNKGIADAVAPVLSAIAKLSMRVDEIVEDRNEENRIIVEALPKDRRRTESRRLASGNFGNRLAAVLRQLQTCLKVDLCIDHCIRDLRDGRKPVIVIESTMEALMRELSEGLTFDVAPARDDAQADLFGADESASDDGAADRFEEGGSEKGAGVVGAPKPPTFADALRLMLLRTITVSLKIGTSRDVEPVEVRFDQDPEVGVEIAAAMAHIDALIEQTPDLSMSPIDDIRERIEAVGRDLGTNWKVNEISARSMRVENGRYAPMPDLTRNQIVAGFQAGEIDVVVVTRAGSTGLSLHASSRVLDQRQRVLYELQIPQNILERMQFFGRVNRKGQTSEPLFVTLSTGLPFEARMLAMQNAKVAELSATVSGNRENVTALDVTDMLDRIGNEVAHNLLESRPSIAGALAISLKVDRDRASDELYFVNKLLQRLALLPGDFADEIYNELLAGYQDSLRAMAAKGQKPHGSRELDGQWDVVDTKLHSPGDPTSGSAFGKPVYLKTIRSMRHQQPMGSDELQAFIAKSWETIGRTPFADHLKVLKSRRTELLESVLPKRFTSVKQALSAKEANAVKLMKDRLDSIQSWLAIRPGARLSIRSEEKELVAGVVLDIRTPALDEAHHPGRYIIRYALPGDEHPREISIAHLAKDPDAIWYPPRETVGAQRFTDFDKVPRGQVPVERRILDGNLFSAVRESVELRYGGIVGYEGKDGIRRRAVLLPRNKVDLTDVPMRIERVDLALDILKQGGSPLFTNPLQKSRGLVLRIELGRVILETPGSKDEAKLFETKDLIGIVGSFQGDWRLREASASIDRLPAILREILASGHSLFCDGRFRAAVKDTDGNSLFAPNSPKAAVSSDVENPLRNENLISSGNSPGREPKYPSRVQETPNRVFSAR